MIRSAVRAAIDRRSFETVLPFLGEAQADSSLLAELWALINADEAAVASMVQAAIDSDDLDQRRDCASLVLPHSAHAARLSNTICEMEAAQPAP